jgi:sec-independent protein translocase protein TatA
MLGNLTGLHLLIILGIVILLFGATKLPALAKGLGQSINIFKKEMGTEDGKKPNTGTTPDGTTYTAAGPTATASGEPMVNPGPSTPNAPSVPNAEYPRN